MKSNQTKRLKMSNIKGSKLFSFYEGEMSKRELEFVAAYKFKEKTADEWYALAISTAEFFEGTDTPLWYGYQSNMEDAITTARLVWMALEKVKPVPFYKTELFEVLLSIVVALILTYIVFHG